MEPRRDYRLRSTELGPELESLAKWMDTIFEIPGTGIRFGLDALIGLIPGLGDTATSLVSLYILNAARGYGIPRTTMMRMAANIAIDYVLGSIPFVGDAFDVYWKANQRNVAILRRYLDVTPAEKRSAQRSDLWFLAILAVGLIVLLVGSITVSVLILQFLWRLLLHSG